MAQLSVEALTKRAKNAESITDSAWRALVNDCYEYAMPQRNILNRVTPGQRKGRHVYDSTAVNSTIAFANRIQTDAMPPFQRWANLTAGPAAKKADEKAIAKQCEEIGRIVFMAMQTGGFDTACNEMLLDLAIGTGYMLIQPGTSDEVPVVYTSIPLAQLSLDEGPNGKVHGFFRKFSPKARNIQLQWPDAVIPASIQKMIDDDSSDKEVELIECCYFDSDAAEQVWRYEVIYPKDKDRLVQRQERSCPFVGSRWIKVAGEVIGRGPLMQNLADIKTLNVLVELILKNASFAAMPMWMYTADNVFNPNTMQIRPGAFAPVSRTGGPTGPGIAPFPQGGDFNVGDLLKKDLQMTIKEGMYDDQLPPEAGAVRSATEIIQRVKQLAKRVGAPFGRLLTEFATPMMQRTIDCLEKRQLVEYINIDGNIVKLQVQSPLALAQQMDDLQALVQYSQLTTEMLGPAGFAMSTNIDKVPAFIARKLGVSSDFVRDSAMLKQYSDQIVAALQAQQQQANPEQIQQPA